MTEARRVRPDADTKRRAALRALRLTSEGLSAQRACELVSGEEGVSPNAVRAWARTHDSMFGRRLSGDEVPAELRRLRDENARLRQHNQELALEVQRLRSRDS